MSAPWPANPFDLTGRVAVVTGAARNIGRATAIALSDAGARILAADINGPGLDETAGMIRARHADAVTTVVTDLTLDTAPADAVAAAVSTYGRLDTVVHAACDYGRGAIEDLTLEQWTQADGLNVRAAAWLTRAAAPHLERSDCGSVVLFSSIQARRGYSDASLYGATKGAIEALTYHLANELGPRQIRVNAIAPGYVPPVPDSDLSQTGAYPLGRYGEPRNVAAAVSFLASPGASWITGAVLPVDGGLAVRHPTAVTRPSDASRWTEPVKKLRRYVGRNRP